jgi:hypothetical protein
MRVPDQIPRADTGQDAAAALTAWLDTLEAGTVVEGAGESFLANETVTLFDRAGVTLQDFTLTRDHWDPEHLTDNHGKILVVAGGQDITLDGLSIFGPHQQPGTYAAWAEGNHGIDLEGVTGCIVQGCRVENTFGDGIYLGAPLRKEVRDRDDIAFRWASSVEIVSCSITGTGRQGISFIGAQDVYVENCYLDNVARTHFDCEPTGEHTGTDTIELVGNKVGSCRNGLLNVHGTANTPADNWTLRRNVQVGDYLGVKPPINLKMQHRAGFTSRRNRFKAAAGPGDNGVYQIQWWTDIDIRRDIWEFPTYDGGKPSRHYGVELQDGCNGVRVRDCQFLGAAGERLDNPRQGVPVGDDVVFAGNVT